MCARLSRSVLCVGAVDLNNGEGNFDTALLSLRWFDLRSHRNLHFGIASRQGRINSCVNLVKMKLNIGPVLASQHHQSYLATGKVLLIPKVFICAQQRVVASLFGTLDQFPVLEFMPSDLTRPGDFRASKTAGHRPRGAIVEKYLHSPRLGTGSSKLSLAK